MTVNRLRELQNQEINIEEALALQSLISIDEIQKKKSRALMNKKSELYLKDIGTFLGGHVKIVIEFLTDEEGRLV